MTGFMQTHQVVFNAQNIQAGFRGGGIFPFEPAKTLRRLANASTSH